MGGGRVCVCVSVCVCVCVSVSVSVSVSVCARARATVNRTRYTKQNNVKFHSQSNAYRGLPRVFPRAT